MRIEARFGLILAFCFALGVGIAGYISFTLEFRQAQEEMQEKASVLLTIALSVRRYTAQEVAPLIKQLDDQAHFHPQSVPSYGAQKTLAGLQQEFPDYSYHERSLNPTNTADRAADWEVGLFRAFQENPARTELSGETGTATVKRFYVSRPLRLTDPACLECHSTPEAAPAAMIAKYGAANGFNWQLGDVIGIQLVEVPKSPIVTRALNGVLTTVGSLVCVFVLTTAIFLLLLRRYVTGPLETITGVAQSVSLNLGPAPQRRGRELDGQFHDLERSITRLKTSLDAATRSSRPRSDA